MSKWLPVCISILILTLAILPLAPAHAQDSISLSSLEVDLWPEYDRPSVLVIYRVVLSSSVTLPVDLTFRLPAASGEPSAVAVRQTTNGESGLFTIPYTRQVSGDWGLITLTATMPELQIEYYDPGLTKQETARQYEYRWPGDYAVDAFSIQVQQPSGAAGMQISPSSGNGVTGQDGLVYYNKQVGSLPAGQTFSLSLDYTKDSDSLTVSNLAVQPNVPVAEPEAALSFRSILPWLLGGLGVALIVGGGIWYWQSGKARQSDREPRHRHRPAEQRQEEYSEGTNIYCHQCGKRAGPGDRFCRVCGTQLRMN